MLLFNVWGTNKGKLILEVYDENKVTVFAHAYDDASHAVRNVQALVNGDGIEGWEGNEPEVVTASGFEEGIGLRLIASGYKSSIDLVVDTFISFAEKQFAKAFGIVKHD